MHIPKPTSAYRAGFHKLGILLAALLAGSGVARAQGEWVKVTPPPFKVGVALQLTDGTILVQENKTPHWWILTPDHFAHYNTGTWSMAADMPADYAPTFFSSAVLADGRVIAEGGEHNLGADTNTNLGAIYTPGSSFLGGVPAGFWTPVSPPVDAGDVAWAHIGDAPGVVLRDGTFMLGNINNKTEAALLNEKSLTWDVIGWTGKNDSTDEEGWTLLPGGYVLTVDTYNKKLNPNATDPEIYDPAKAAWASAGSTIVPLTDYPPFSTGCGRKPSPYDHEIGPAVLRPDGTVFATGANLCGAGNTAIYDTHGSVTDTGKWKAGPPIPNGYDVADGPASILPDGNVLVDTSPAYGAGPSLFWEFGLDGSWIPINQPADLPASASTVHARMLVTGSGSVMLLLTDSEDIWIYTKRGGWSYPDSWRPTICGGCYPKDVYIGQVNYAVDGTQFNGLSQGAAYGDDAQSASNYPLVLFTNNASGHKFYARTHDHSTMGVATGDELVGTLFDITPNIEPGPSTMVVIANGIPSLPVNIRVHPAPGN